MFRNYVFIALRQIWRSQLQSTISIVGLAVGFTATILILLYVQDELSYDDFHSKADQIYRISSHSKIGDNERHWSLVPSTVAPAVIQELPGVKSQARITTIGKSSQVVQYKDQQYDESIGPAPYGRVYRVDAAILDLFSYTMTGLQGSKALVEPKSVVISRQAANKLFKGEQPLGKQLEFANMGSFEVTAIIEVVPINTHFQFDYLLSFDFDPANTRAGFYWVRSYIELDPNADPAVIETALGDIGRAAQPSLADNGIHMDYFLQNIREIHLFSGLEYELYPTNNKTYIFIFLAICAFILTIATINFINLSSAQLSTRTMEMGLRKVMGANRSHMRGLFITYSVLVSLLAFLTAIGLTFLVIEPFNVFSAKDLSLSNLLQPIWIIGNFILLGLIALITGLYPAIIVNGMSAIIALKAKHAPGSSTQLFRKLLVIFQFTISVTLIVCTFVIIQQLHFMRNKNLGFETEQVLNVMIDGNLPDYELNTLKQTFTKYSNIRTATLTTGVPGIRTNVSVMRPEGFDENNTQRLDMIYADFDFIKTFNIRLLAGRDFDPRRSTDSLNFIINKSAAEKFGWGVEGAVGKQMNYLQGPISGKGGKVIAVMDDFHYQSLHNPIGPLLLGIRSTNFNVMNFQFLSLKTKVTDMEDTLDEIRSSWTELIPEKPLSYSFLNDSIRKKYDQEERLGTLLTSFAILAIGIACMGLLGLTSFIVRLKTKEIGIRKVLGANPMQVWSRLSLSFLILVAIANGVAWPLGYYFMDGWLGEFSYRIDIPYWIFLLAGVSSLVITLLTTGLHTIKATLANPIEAIRYE